MHRRHRSLRYSVLIGSIFLNLHFFFMWCIHIFRTSLFRLVRTHEGKKRQLNSISSLYKDKKELLPYRASHCYWMIFPSNIYAYMTTAIRWALCVGPLLWLGENPKHFSIALSASSTLLCQARMFLRTLVAFRKRTPWLLLFYSVQEEFLVSNESTSFPAFNPFALHHFISVLWIFY